MGKLHRAGTQKKRSVVEPNITQGLRANPEAEAAATAAAARNCHQVSIRLPLVVALNCLPDCSLEEEALRGVASIEHVSLAQVAEGKIEAAAAVLLHSLAYLPRAAQRRLQPWQLILTLSCMDKMVDSALASELGLQLLHVDSGRAEEIADTVMALLLGLLRHTHVLASHGYASAGWLGTMHACCRGMRRSKGMVLGIVGATASACAVATRSLAFRMKVIYFDPDERDGPPRRRVFPAAAKKVNTLKELLSVSDIVTLHCALTNDTVQLINAESLHHIKPGAVVVNTSSSHLLDDCALKQALISGTVAGCALDGIEGPQWLEAWVREMPNVLILPRSADYSEEVWAEIRSKAAAILCSFLVDGVIPANTASEEDDDQSQDSLWQEEPVEKPEKHYHPRRGGMGSSQRMGEAAASQEFRSKQLFYQAHEQSSHSSHGVKGMGSKGRRPNRKKQHPSFEPFALDDPEPNWVAGPRDDCGSASASGQERAANPDAIPQSASPKDQLRLEDEASIVGEGEAEEMEGVETEETGVMPGLLTEGLVVALFAPSLGGYYVARQKGPGRGWCLDNLSDVTPRDPAAQFLVVVRSKDRIGLRSLAAGGKLLQANKKQELVFVNNTLDAWESWIVEGAALTHTTLTNNRFRAVSLDASIEILAAVGEDDGVARWLIS